ncbi:MAG: hypothetical protein WC650_02340 [Candidatus Doudnabacteria bacterium]
MDLNKIIKIVAIIVILIIAGSVFYYYLFFLPNQQKLGEERARKEKLLGYRIKFQEECDRKYDEVYENWKQSMQTNPDLTGFFLEQREKMCKEKVDWFDIDSYIFCQNGNDYGHTRDTYVPACIEWKMKQIDI